MTARTFLALDIDESIRRALVAAAGRLAHRGANFRATGVDNLHVTLSFLGDVTDGLLAEVCSQAGAVAAAVEPFDFGVKGTVCVPPQGQLRMVWAGVADPTGRLAKLHAMLSDALATLGLRTEERGFMPHITLARIKYAADPNQFRQAAEELAGADFGTQHAGELVVYTSRLTPSGPVYTAVARPKLGRDRGGQAFPL